MNVLYEDFLKFWLVFMFIMFIINLALIKIKKSKFDWLSKWENILALAEHLFSQQATPKTLIEITALSVFDFGIKRKSIRVIIKLKQVFWKSKVIWFHSFSIRLLIWNRPFCVGIFGKTTYFILLQINILKVMQQRKSLDTQGNFKIPS